jgi:CMP-N-acetylneuraminic acid synthetase
LYYVVEAARKATLVEDLVVSTEDSFIADIAKRLGVKVLTRPSIFASDEIPLAVVMRDILETYDSVEDYYDAILSLQATSPLVSSDTIDEVIAKFHEERCSAVATISRIKQGHPYLSKRIVNSIAKDFVRVPNVRLYPKRNLEASYYFNGALFLRDRCLLADYDYTTNALGSRVTVVEMNEEESVNIDTEFDFKIAKLLLEARRNK